MLNINLNNLTINDLSILDENKSEPTLTKGSKLPLLYDHQKLLVKVIDSIEKVHLVKLDSKVTEYYSDITINDVFKRTNIINLNEKIGTGKTIIILALISQNKVPMQYPENILYNMPLKKVNNYNSISKYITPHFYPGLIKDIRTSNFIYRQSDYCMKLELLNSNSFMNDVEMRYKKKYNCNLIFVNSSCVYKWADEIKSKSKLRYFILDTHTAYNRFLLYLTSDDIDLYYDIILIKYSKTNISPENKHITTLIYEKTRFITWSRVIFDDIDILPIKINHKMPNGLFYIFISSTNIMPSYTRLNADYTFISALLYPQYECGDNEVEELHVKFINNMICNSYLTLKCDELLIKQSINIPPLICYNYHIKLYNDKLLNIINELPDDDAKLILDMINSDSTNSAAKYLNITSNNVADLFMKLIGDEYNNYKKITYYHNKIIHLKQGISNEISSEISRGLISENLLSLLTELNLSSQVDRDMNSQYIKSDECKNLIFNLEIEYNDKKCKLERMITVIQNKASELLCPICMDNITGTSMILRCCGFIMCSNCGLRACNMEKVNKDINGKCPQCRYKFSLSTNVIYFNNKLETILTEPLLIESPLIPSIGESNNNDNNFMIDNDNSSDNIVNNNTSSYSKTDVLVYILDELFDKSDSRSGETSHILRQMRHELLESDIKSRFKNILYGLNRVVTDETPTAFSGSSVNDYSYNRKIIIFSRYKESIDNIKRSLLKNGYNYLSLCGTALNIYNTLLEFKKSNVMNILIINASNICAGLDIQFATDIILYHKMTDIESQVIGRIQRMGRTCSATIHLLSYENENSINL